MFCNFEGVLYRAKEMSLRILFMSGIRRAIALRGALVFDETSSLLQSTAFFSAHLDNNPTTPVMAQPTPSNTNNRLRSLLFLIPSLNPSTNGT